jgi:hypothetical protein
MSDEAGREVDEKGRVVLVLSEPITVGKRVVEELRFRTIKAKDLQGLPENNIDKTLVIVARLSGETSHVVGELSMVDLAEVSEIVAGFMPAGLTTGSTT